MRASRRFDRTLAFDKPAALARPIHPDDSSDGWTEAIPLGNGRLGAMVYGGVGRDQILINEESVWAGPPVADLKPDLPARIDEARRLIFAGRFREADDYCGRYVLGDRVCPRSYQPAGYLVFESEKSRGWDEYHRCLDIGSAIASVRCEVGEVRFFRETLVSIPRDVVVMHMSATSHHGECRFSLEHPLRFAVGRLSDFAQYMSGQANHDGKHRGTRFGIAVRVVADGTITQTDRWIRVHDSREITVFVAVRTDYNADEPSRPLETDLMDRCRSDLSEAADHSYSEIRAEHVEAYRSLFERIDLDVEFGEASPRSRREPSPGRVSPTALGALPEALTIDRRLSRLRNGESDPELLLFYFHYCRYLLIASSFRCKLPSNLQGIWNPLVEAPWNSDYHINVNLQENYWFADSVNLPECNEPFFTYVERLIDSGRNTARELGCAGSFASVEVDPWLDVTIHGEPVYGMWFMGAAWSAQHFIEHFRHTQDFEFLRNRAYPVLKECARFFLDWLIEDPGTGELVSGPSTSPENSFLDEQGRPCAITMGCTCDQEIIWHTFTSFLEASTALGAVDHVASRVAQALPKLALPEIGRDGRLREWAFDLPEQDPGHRHVSHLYGIMPGHRISLRSTPELASAVAASLEARLAHDYDAQGWSLGWIASIFARLGRGDRAIDLIEGSYAKKLYPNLFVDAHGHVQVGDMMGVAAALVEMLIQSDTDATLEILPALPSTWIRGSLRGFKTRGGITVDLEWEEGGSVVATLNSAVARRFTIRYRGNERTIDLAAGRPSIFREET